MRRHIPRILSTIKHRPRAVAHQLPRLGSFRSYASDSVASASSSSSTSIFSPSPNDPSSSKPFYITTPIFYVNASPHLGHLHSLVLADTFARFAKLRKPARQLLLTTGTDEHGLKIQQAAKNQGVGEQEFCDLVSETFKRLADEAGIGYTDFIRTSEQRHHRAVHDFWQRLVDSGDIYKGTHAGWYSVSDECFYSPSQVQKLDDGRTIASETGNEVVWEEEENWKFRLPKYRDRLLSWVENPSAVYPSSIRTSVINMMQAAEDLSVSRPASRVRWGVPVPNDPEQTIYVWVDALVNYLTSLGYPSETSGWPVDMHVVGKDIVRFHAVHWPALLFSAGLSPPTTVLAHAHWTMGHSKMSKSRGNVVDPFAAMAEYGTDAVRFYLMRAGGALPTDSDYSTDQLHANYTFLSSQLGNLLARIASPRLLKKVGSFKADRPEPEIEVALSSAKDAFGGHLERFEVTRACDVVTELISTANKVFTRLEPWKPNNDSSNAIIYSYAALRIAGILMQPVMPRKSAELLDRLGILPSDRSFPHATWEGGDKVDVGAMLDGLKKGKEQWKEAGHLFPQIEQGKKPT